MSFLAKLLFGTSFGVLFILVYLRFSQPQIVVGTNTGFWINAAWAIAFLSGIAEWKRLFKGFDFRRYLFVRAILVITVFYICGITDAALELQYFSYSDLNPIAIAFFAIVAVAIAISWWKIVFKGAITDSRELRARSMLWLAFVVVCVLIVFLRKTSQ